MTNQKSPWAIALMVAIVAVIIGGGVYFWPAQNPTSTGDRDSISEEASQEITDIIDADQQANPSQDIVYTNVTYGFTLTFPSTWKDYTTKSRTIQWTTYGNNDSVDFGFPVQDDLFNLGIHPKSQWVAMQSEEGPIPTYLGESNEYIFSYSTGQYAANDEMMARMGEVKDIVKTFALQPTD